MKSILTNKLILMWVVIILLIANLSAVVTVIYRYRNIPESPPQIVFNKMRNNYNGPIWKQLNFNIDQMKEFKAIKIKFHNEANLYENQMHEIRMKIADELISDHPDPDKLDQLAMDFGVIQTELKKISFQHFSAIKEMCTDEQRKIFNSNINNIVEHERPGPGHFGRRQYGYKNRFNNKN